MNKDEKTSIDKIIKIMEEELKNPKDIFVSFNVIKFSNGNNFVKSVNVGPLSKRARNEMLFSLISGLIFPGENVKDALESFLKFSEDVANKKILNFTLDQGDCLCQESKKS